MEQNSIRSNRWNEAARYGLIFGAISAAYLYLGHLQSALGVSGTFGSVLGFVLWAVKFVVCIKLMRYAMGKFCIDNPSAARADIFKLGMLIAFMSALVYSIVTVADMLYVFPEYYHAVYSVVLEEYAKVLPAQQIEEFKEILVDAPKFAFFGNLVYCFLYGTVLSFILSRNLPSNDISQNYKSEE